MAHIRRLDAHRWQARYRGPDGRERARNFTRRSDAERYLTTVESAKLRGGWVDPESSRISVADWSDRWLTTVEPTLKPKTVATYRSLLRSRILPTFDEVRLGGLRPSEVQTWIGSMQADGISASRIRQAHVVLSSMLEAAVRDGRIARNVARGVRLPRLERREAPFFEPETVDRIVAVAPRPYGAFLAVQGLLGLRFGEAAALRRGSVNFLRRRLIVDTSLAEIGGQLHFGPTKSHAARAVPIPAPLVEVLAHHLEDVDRHPEALLFTSARGLPLRYSRFRPTVWVPLLERLGLPKVGLHVLRHSAAARMIGAGWSPKAVQQVLGHGSAAFTLSVYGHLFEDDLDDLAEALVSSSRGFSADSGASESRISGTNLASDLGE